MPGGGYQDAETGLLIDGHKHDRWSHQHQHQHQHHELQRTSSLPHPEPKLHELPLSSYPAPVLRRTTSTHRVPAPEARAKVKQFISHRRSSSADRGGHYASSFTQGQWARASAHMQYRQRGRFVQLPAHMGNSEEDGEVALLPAEGQRGRITVFTRAAMDAINQHASSPQMKYTRARTVLHGELVWFADLALVCDAFEQATVIKAIQRKHASTTCSSCSEVVLVQGRIKVSVIGALKLTYFNVLLAWCLNR
eukprot:scaffold67876_cov19-Tisochrysis_lutea.AAC.1